MEKLIIIIISVLIVLFGIHFMVKDVENSNLEEISDDELLILYKETKSKTFYNPGIYSLKLIKITDELKKRKLKY